MKDLVVQAKKEIERAEDLKDLDRIFKRYLAGGGDISRVFKSLKNLPNEQRKETGKRANAAKKEIKELIKAKAEELERRATQVRLEKEKIDISRPGKRIERGSLHPLTLIQKEVEEVFSSMGFSIAEGPEIESEWYNFDALNIPKDHPARDIWDTFWLQSNQKVTNSKKPRRTHPNFKETWAGLRGRQIPSKSQKLLLRTHTSPVQIRYMEKHQPPLRIIAPGRVFRYEATDASHEINFYQLEGLMVDEHISAANFKAIIQEFLKRFFKTDIEMRLRPSFFPFTEPSFEIDVRRKMEDWLELMGAGMVHPNVFKAAGLNPRDWTGFAFGVGLDRLAMVKYRINDIRLFYSGDLRFLKQF